MVPSMRDVAPKFAIVLFTDRERTLVNQKCTYNAKSAEAMASALAILC